MRLERLDYVVLVVRDLERSLAFYVDRLGIPLNHRSDDYAQLRCGSCRLSLYTREAMAATLGHPLGAPDPAAPGFELGFKVEDVDESFAELVAAGVPAASPPVTRTWGQRSAYLRDPDGYLVELVQDLSTPPGK